MRDALCKCVRPKKLKSGVVYARSLDIIEFSRSLLHALSENFPSLQLDRRKIHFSVCRSNISPTGPYGAGRIVITL
jgi:hypothetical protein